MGSSSKQKSLQHKFITWKGLLTMAFGHIEWNMCFNKTTCYLAMWPNLLIWWMIKRSLNSKKWWVHLIIMQKKLV